MENNNAQKEKDKIKEDEAVKEKENKKSRRHIEIE